MTALRRVLPALFVPLLLASVASTGCDIVTADLRSEEFHAFLENTEGLSGTLEGTASFDTVEGGIRLSLIGDGNGGVRVSGEAVDPADTGNRLLFDFAVDQACLRDICQSLEYLLAAFPVTGTRDA